MRIARKDQLEAAIVKTTRMLANQGVTVTQRGGTAYCAWHPKTGKVISINLPMLPDEPTEAFLDALQGFIDHEVAHALYTAALDMEAREQASVLNKGPKQKAVLHNFANVVEDIRIEARVPKDFPGAEANLNKLRAHIIEKVWEPAWQQAKDALDRGEEVPDLLKGTLMIPFLRGLAGQRVCADFVKANGIDNLFVKLVGAIPNLEGRLKSMKSVEDAVDLAELIMRVAMPPENPKPKQPDQPEPPKDKSKDKDQPSLGKGGDGDPEDEDEGETDTPPPPPQGEDEDEGEGSSDDSDDDADAPGSGGEEQDDTDKDGSGTGDADEDDDCSGSDDDGSDDDDDDDDASDDADADDSDDDGSDDDKFGGGKRNMSLQEAMRRLDPTQRKALYWYQNKRQSVDEIAGRLNLDQSAVMEVMKQGRRNLARLMNKGA